MSDPATLLYGAIQKVFRKTLVELPPDMKNRRGQKNEHPRILAAYICKRCEIEGQDFEVSPKRALCWNCQGEAMITARIAMEAA
jgi:hypothetical protein